MATFDKLKKLFNPHVIAVIGASGTKGSVGYDILNNLIGSGYEGTVYPVNNSRQSVQGVKAYPSVLQVPDKIDLAIIATPAETVPDIVKECGEAGVNGIVIISAGFSEVGEHGKELVDKILEYNKKYDNVIIGPNCLGFIKPSKYLNASFANKMALPGKIAFISQSGALCTSILDWSVKNNVGFSHFVSIGSMIDVGFHDLIDYFGQDPETNSIIIYMESITDARRFLSAARAFSRSKPIILLKVGKSKEGAKAAMSHTGSLTGNDAIFNAAFKRAGIIRVDTIGELFDAAQALSMQKRPAGKRLAVVTNAGGPGVIVTDSLIEKGGELAALSEKTMAKLNEVMPPAWSHGNPIDVLGDAKPELYKTAVGLCLEDNNVDGILLVLTPQSMTDLEGIAHKVIELPNRGRKTILASWMGEDDVRCGCEILKKGSIPCFRVPEDAVKTFMNMYNYSRNLELLYETPETIPDAFNPEKTKAKNLIKNILKEKRYVLTEYEAKKLLEFYHISVIKNTTITSENEVEKIADEVGFPVAMKIMSPDIMHKTDVGGVIINVSSAEEARIAFRKIMESVKRLAPRAKIEGILVEQMISKRYELIIGSEKDSLFGPSICFGMGGVAVEVFNDINIGLPPLNMALALRLIEETKIYELLKGYRGMEGVDIETIQFLLYKFAYLLSDFPEIKSIEINPFGVDAVGGTALDAKVVLDKDIAGKRIEPYSHMVISPYPSEYVTTFMMNDGREAILRPIRPEDEPMEEEMFRNFSEQTQRFRFFQLIKDITHELLIRYTQIDYYREIAIIAEVNEKNEKKMAGVVRLIADPYNETAEFAIVVTDPWQFRGLGNKLTDYILEIARERKIKKVYASVLDENVVMLHMLRKRGFKITGRDGENYCEFNLK
jgi:acetyltransferase